MPQCIISIFDTRLLSVLQLRGKGGLLHIQLLLHVLGITCTKPFAINFHIHVQQVKAI